MNKSDFSKIRKGDRVYSIHGPECEIGGTNAIVENDCGDGFITVQLDGGKVKVYWPTGHVNYTDSFPSLFWSRPTIEIPPPPRRKKWVTVEVRPFITSQKDVYLVTINNDFIPSFGNVYGPVQTIEVEVYDE